MKPKDISYKDYELLKDKYKDNLEEIINKVNNGYPVQYLIGNVEFINTIINVDERVLIPRFETERLVDMTISYLKNQYDRKIKILDLGTGSGCIAIALKKNIDCDVTAIDISPEALDLAKENAKLNNVEVNFKLGDMLEDLDDDYDVIISNPPYIPNNGYVQDTVLKYEPHLALFAQDNGLYYIKEIIKKHLDHINHHGMLFMEFGDNQKDSIMEYLEDSGLNFCISHDLAGMPRYLRIDVYKY